MNIYTASHQWANRPADERYWNLEEMLAAARIRKAESQEKLGVQLSACRAMADPRDGRGLLMTGPNGGAVAMSHFGFSQVVTRIGHNGGAAEYLRSLPADLAAQCLNHGFEKATGHANFLLNRPAAGGVGIVRSCLSDSYVRLWDVDAYPWLINLTQRGWRVPPARPAGIPGERTRVATAADVLPGKNSRLSIREGDTIAPGGVYASDRDSFVFLVNQERAIEVNGFCGFRALMASNSEVGTGAVRIDAVLYDTVCGNHILWGAKLLGSWRANHTGLSMASRVRRATMDASRQLADASADTEARVIRAAQAKVIASEKKEVIQMVYNAASGAFTMAEAEDSWKLAEQWADVHGAPNTVWGFTSGMTRLSQSLPYASGRNRIDAAAGKLLQALV